MIRNTVAALALPLALLTAACGSSATDQAPTTPGASESTPTAARPEPTTARATTPSPDATGRQGDSTQPQQADGQDAPAVPAGDAVERYCRSVDELISDYREELAAPDGGGAADLASRAQELATQAADLVDDAVKDPSVGEQLSACSAKLENLANPELPTN
jgi:hypothetical protein